jgi:protein O-mannosyl-transferase
MNNRNLIKDKPQTEIKLKIFINISDRLSYIILFLLIALVYSQNLSFKYTNFDDDTIIIRNEKFLENHSNIIYSFTRDSEFQVKSNELYRPLQNLTFFIDSYFFGVKPFGFHLTNILLHLINCFLLFSLFKKLRFSIILSLFGASIFAIHPIFAYTVSWIPSRGDLLLALFGILSMMLYIKYTETKIYRYLVFYLIAFSLALFSKESAIMLIFICLAYHYAYNVKFKINIATLILFSSYIIIAIFYFALRDQSITDTKTNALGISQFIFNLPVIPETFWKFFIPLKIVVFPFYSISRTLAGMIVLVLFLMLAFYKAADFKIKLWGLFVFLSLYVPSMIYKPAWSEYIYHYLIHRSYFPMVGIVIMILLVLKSFDSTANQNKLKIFVLSIIIVFSILSFNFNKTFSSPLSFWTSATQTNPKSAYAFLYLGNAWYLKKNYDASDSNYNKSIKLKPDFYTAYYNKGISLLSRNEFNEAISCFSKSLEIEPKNISSLENIVQCYLKINDFQKSQIYSDKLFEIDPNNLEYRYYKAQSLFFQKKFADSETLLEKILSETPDNQNVYRMAALSNSYNQHPNEAIIKFKKLILNNPDNIGLLTNLGYAYWEADEYLKADSIFNMLQTKDSNNLDISLGTILCKYSLKSPKLLNAQINKALKIQPVLKNGKPGLDSLEKQGFFYTQKQINTLGKILK